MEFSKVSHLDMERSVALIELPTGHLLIQGIIKGESQSIMFCRDAALAVSELVQEWARQDKESAGLHPTTGQGVPAGEAK